MDNKSTLRGFCLIIILFSARSYLLMAEIRVENVVVTGAYTIPERWILRRAGIQTSFADEHALEIGLQRCAKRLLGTERFLFVESFFIPVSGGDKDNTKVEVYLNVTESLMPYVGSKITEPTLFRNLPFYGWGLGFFVSEKEQTLAIFPVLGPPVAAGILAGHAFVNDSSALSFQGFFGADLWPFWSVELGATGLIPLTVTDGGVVVAGLGAVALLADYSYLLDMWGIGFRNAASLHAGYSDTYSLSFEEDLRIYAQIFRFLQIALRGRLYSSISTALYGYSMIDFLGDAYRAATPSFEDDFATVVSFDIRFPQIITLDIGFTDFLFGAYCFFDGILSRELLNNQFFPAAGGGIKLALGMPLNLTFLVGYGWGFATDAGRFLISVGAWY